MYLNIRQKKITIINKFPYIFLKIFETRRIIDLIFDKNHYILLKKLHVFIGKHDSQYVCRHCLNSYTIQSELITHKILCGNKNKSVYIPCKESHIKWNNYYQKMPIHSLIIADFEARKEPIYNENKQHCNTTDITKQIPCCNGFYIINTITNLPIYSGYYKSSFGKNNVEWFSNKINNKEIQMREFFKQNLQPKITIKSEKKI